MSFIGSLGVIILDHHIEEGNLFRPLLYSGISIGRIFSFSCISLALKLIPRSFWRQHYWNLRL